MSARLILTILATLCILVLIIQPVSTVKAGGPLANIILIADQADPIVHPALAYNPQTQQYLTVWCQQISGSNTIYARLISKTGVVDTIYPVSATTYGVDRCDPDVTYNSAHQSYLIVWDEKSGSAFNVVGRIFVPGVSTSEDIIINANSSSVFVNPAVAYSSTSDEFLVVWADKPYGGNSSILAQRLSWTGVSLGGNQTIAQGGGVIHNYDPDVTYNPARDEYLIVWTRLDNGAPGGSNNDVYGRIVTEDLIPLHDFLQIGFFTPQEEYAVAAAIPTAVPESGRYLVSWQVLYATGDHDVWARIVLGDGTLMEVINIAGSYLDERLPAVAANSTSKNFLVTWNSTYGPDYPLNKGIRGRNFSLDGKMLGADWAGGLIAERSAVAPGPMGDFLIAAEDTFFFGTQNLYGRLWGNRVYLPQVKK